MSDNELLKSNAKSDDGEPAEKAKNNDDGAVRKPRILYLYKILYEQTDDEHGLTMPELIQKLGEYGITAARKAIYSDIKALEEFGINIESEKGPSGQYRILNREFELPELTALADAIIGSHFFSSKKAAELIDKLSVLCSKAEAENLAQTKTLISGPSIEDNESILYNVDAIHRAIAQKKQISFDYYEYSFDYALKRPQNKNRGKHTCSPITLAWNDGKYYLIAYYQKYKGISHFRIDKMKKVEIQPEEAEQLPKNFKLSEYMKSTFSMFSGELVDVTLRFKNSLMNAVIDRFGKITPRHDGLEHFKFTTPVRINKGKPPMAFFGWLFQFGTDAQIIGPDPVRDQYFEMLSAILNNKYTDD